MRNTEWMQQIIEDTGAVVMGRNAFAMADDPDWFADNYEFQTPIFVLMHQAPDRQPRETERLRFTFVSGGIESAVRQARDAAGDKDVTVIGGASTLRQCIQAGLADELHIDIMPLLFGGGLRLFEDTDNETIQLERLDPIETDGARTQLKYRVIK
jgi:dihydrofolate reductase